MTDPTTTDERAADPPGEGQPAGEQPAGAATAQERSDLAAVVGTPASRAVRLAALVGLVVLLGVTQGISMLIVVAAIVIMIFLHELGHYVMARRAGMLVTEFFIGFGPRIWSFHRGETEYGIKAIPAGAYVRIVGMSNMEDVDPALEDRTYRQKSFSQRLGVAVAGSAMHFLIAIVLLFVQFAFIGGPDGDRWAVGDVTPASAADAAGIREGDELVSLDGRPVGSFDEFRELIPTVEPGTIDAEVVRDGETLVLPVELSVRTKLIGTIREDVDLIDNGERLVVGAPLDDGVAAGAGLAGGETLVSVDGTPVDSLEQIPPALRGAQDGTVVLGVRDDDGSEREAQVDLGSEIALTEPGAFVGVGSAPVLVTQPVPEAAVSTASTFGRVAQASISGVGRFLWPPNLFGFIVDAVSGGDADLADQPTAAASTPSNVDETRPISIVGVAILGSDLSSEDLSNLVLFLAQLNIFIGIFNLFPLLPFDGGHVVIAMYEKAQEVRRRSRQRYLADVSRMLPVAYGVVIVLVVVGVLAIFVDLTRGVSL